MVKYIYAFDPTIEKIVLFKVRGRLATSVISGAKFKLRKDV